MPYFSFKYVFQGEEQYRTCGEELMVQKGQFILVQPNEQVCTTIEMNDGLLAKGVCLYFSPYLLKGLTKRYKKGIELLYYWPKIAMNATNIQLTQALVSNNMLENREYFYKVLKAFLLTTARVIDLLPQTKAIKQSTQIELWIKVERAKTYILKNLDRDISLKDISEAQFLSPFYLIRTVKHNYQRTHCQ